MNRKLLAGLCIMIALVFASFAGHAATDEEISDMLIQKIDEQQLMGALAEGIEESIYNLQIEAALGESNGTFFEGFESGTFATNNWTSYGTGNNWVVGSASCYAGTYCAVGEPVGGLNYLETNIDTSGYINIWFSYYRQDSGLDSGEYCGAEWYDGTSWNQVDSAVLGWGYTERNYSLNSNANNNPSFKIRFKISAGSNNERCLIDNVKVSGTKDSTKPVTTLIEPADNYFNDSMDPVNVTFTCSATDNIGLDEISLYITNRYNQSFSINSTSSITGTSDSASWTLSLLRGNYTWNCIAYDAAGNYDWGNSNRTFKLNYTDKVSPTISLNYPPDNYNSTIRSIVFNWTAADNYDQNATCNLTIDNTVNISTVSQNGIPSVYNISGFGDGAHYWNVTCTDKAGNKNTSETRKFTVDPDAPSVDLNFPYANYSTSSTSINFNWTAADNFFSLLSCNLTIDGQVNATVFAVSGAPENYTVSGLSEADHYWNVTCWDSFGNTNTSETRKFTVDHTNPQVQFVNPTTATGNYSQTWISANVTAYDTNLDYIKIYLYLSGGALVNSTSSQLSPLYINFTNLADGIYHLNATANDTAGNRNSTETRAIRIDTTPPSIALNFPTNYYASFETAINFSWTANDNLASYMVCNLTINSTVNASSVISQNGVPVYYYVSGFDDGTYYWNVTCKDDMGYVNTSETRSFTINTKVPAIMLNSPPDSALDVDGNITFNCTASDNNSLDRIELYINSTLNQTEYVSGTENNSIFYLNSTENGSSYYWTCLAYNYLNFSNILPENRTLSVDFGAAPVYSPGYFAGNTTDWNREPDIKNVCGGNAVLDRPPAGKVKWYGCVDASWANFDENVMIEYNNITVLAGIDSTFNSSAEITIRNLAWDAAPDVYRDGTICLPPDCSSVNYNATSGIAVFNVTHFTSYTTRGNTQLMIWDETDPGMPYAGKTRYPYQQAVFFANYTRAVNGNPITGATCTINFTGSSGTMSYNSTKKLYEYNRSFSTNGTFEWNVTCSAATFQTLTTNDTVYITPDLVPPSISLNSPENEYNTTSVPLSVNFSWTAADNYDQNMTCNLTINGIVNASSIASPNGTPVNYTVTGFLENAYYWNVTCWDDFNNTNTSETRVFRVDQTPPNITINSPLAGAKYDQYSDVTITATVIDAVSTVSVVYANVIWHNYSYSTIVPMSKVGATNQYKGNFTNTTEYGFYNFTVFANDTLGNAANATSYFQIAIPKTAFVTCTLTETPQVAEAGERILFQADVAYSNGVLLDDVSVAVVNLTIYYLNNTNKTAVHNEQMTYLQDGVWYYEFDATSHENGNYMGIADIVTNEVPPDTTACSALATISGRGIFRITGVSPDLVNVNETVRLAMEVTSNGELVDSSLLVNPELWVVQINGTTSYYNLSTGLSVSDGLVYLDGEFNETGVYYLNWSMEYYNRTKQVQEIIVAKDWDEKLENVSASIGDLINENRERLIEVLSEMERQQEFSEEEIFLITDAVNSMSRVANLLADGEITEEEAQREMDRINREIEEKTGGKLAGYLRGTTEAAADYGISWWMALLVAVIVLGAMMVRQKIKQKRYNEYGIKTRRRYEAVLGRIRFIVRLLSNKNRQRQFAPAGKNMTLTKYLEKRRNAERQETLYEALSGLQGSVARGVGRMRNRIRQNTYRPARKRRFEIMIDSIKNNIANARKRRELRMYERKEEAARRQLTRRRKAKPQEIFRPPAPKEEPRYSVALKNLKKGMHDYIIRKKSTRHMHMQKTRDSEGTHTRMKAKDLFGAIDEYKYNEGSCWGMMRQEPVDTAMDDYEKGARYAAFEESRAITGIRNAIAAVRQSVIGETARKAAQKIPKPRMPKISVPKINIKSNVRGRIADIRDIIEEKGMIKENEVAKLNKTGKIDAKKPETIIIEKEKKDEKEKKPKPAVQKKGKQGRRRYEVIAENLRNRIAERRFKKEKQKAEKLKNREQKLKKPKIEKTKEQKQKKQGKGGRRRYQLLAEKARKNFAPEKDNESIKAVKETAEKDNIRARIYSLESRESQRENDKIRHLAWNIGSESGSANMKIRKAFPEENDAEAFQSMDSEIVYPKQTKKQMLGKLKEMYNK